MAGIGSIRFSRVRMAAALATLACALCRFDSVKAESQSVVWTNLVNAAVSGATLQKTGGCDGCDDAGATSQQTITQGDAFIEFTVGEQNTF